MEQFRVVDLQQHSCDLACPLTVLALWENMCEKIDTAGGEQVRPKEKIKTLEGQQFSITEWKNVQELMVNNLQNTSKLMLFRIQSSRN